LSTTKAQRKNPTRQGAAFRHRPDDLFDPAVRYVFWEGGAGILRLIAAPDPGARPIPRVVRLMAAGFCNGVPTLGLGPSRLLRHARNHRFEAFHRNNRNRQGR